MSPQPSLGARRREARDSRAGKAGAGSRPGTGAVTAAGDRVVPGAQGSSGTPETHGGRHTAEGSDQPRLLDVVTGLREEAARTRFTLPFPGSAEAETRRLHLLQQLDDHLLPRLRELSAPALVVVAGSTGAGKSTLVNSVLREEVSPAGVLRPTTRRPVLAHHPEDAELLAQHPLAEVAEMAATPAVPRGLALVDAPDLDSLLATNRDMAHRLLTAADLLIFLTTAARYGDAVPWGVLAGVVERRTSMAMVLNRVPADALATVRADLLDRLRRRGMTSVPLFHVPDAGPHEGMLAAEAVAPVLRWLETVAGPERARSVIARTQRGAVVAVQPWADELADAVEAQIRGRTDLEELVAAAVADAAARTAAAVTAGRVADGPVRTRWLAYARGGGPLSSGRWDSRRAGGARVAALAEVREDLAVAVAATFAAARHDGELAVTAALLGADAPGAAALVPGAIGADGGRPADRPGASSGDGAAVVGTAERSAADWVAGVRDVTEELLAGPAANARAGVRLTRAIGRDGVASLVALAASGLGAARAVLTDAVGSAATHAAVGRAEADLARRAAEQATAGADPVRALLASPHLADHAGEGLRRCRAALREWS